MLRMTVEELKEHYKNSSAIIEMCRPNVDMKSEYYKLGYIDGGLNQEHKPYRYGPCNYNNIIGKLTGKEASQYELGFYDGIMSENPKKYLNENFGIKFGSLL